MPTSPSMQPESAQQSWLGWHLRLFGTACICLITLVLLNFVINPLGYYPTRFFPVLSATDSIQKRDALVAASPQPEVLILGSSKSMRLPPGYITALTGSTAFNAASSAAVPSDMLKMLQFAFNDAGIRPKLILVGVDLEMFQNGNRPTGHLPARLERAKAVLSIDQLRESLRSLWYWERNAYPPATRVIDRDGALREPALEKDVRRGVDVFARDLPSLTESYKKIWSDFSSISQTETTSLRELLAHSRAQRARVIVFLTPTHPLLEQSLRHYEYESRKRQVQQMLKDLCAQEDVEYVDLSSLASFGGDAADFYDGMHVKPHNAELMLRRLVGPDAVQ
jgi:hypothetical protein